MTANALVISCSQLSYRDEDKTESDQGVMLVGSEDINNLRVNDDLGRGGLLLQSLGHDFEIATTALEAYLTIIRQKIRQVTRGQSRNVE